jgi:5'-phosphate synthase pdxT subunit
MLHIGVVALQGDVSEHVEAVRRCMVHLGLEGDVVHVRRRGQVPRLDGLVIPGGESTTISRLMRSKGIDEEVVSFAREGGSVMGTCAGAILLAKEGDEQVRKTSTRLLFLMDMEVSRNAFGRQRESFEVGIEIEGFESPYPGVFIRAPAILRVRGECRAVGRYGKRIVMATQGNLMALTFHPELTQDMRVHELFLKTMK